MDLRGKYPTDTFQYLVTTDGRQLFTGTGSLITSLLITSITSSFVTQSFVTESFVHALRIETDDITSSYIKMKSTNPGDVETTIFQVSGTLVITSSGGGEVDIGFGIVSPEHGIILSGDGRLVDVNEAPNTLTMWNATQRLTSSNVSVNANGQISSSYISYTTSSTPPSNSSSVAAWLNVTANGSIFKLPLYQ